MFHGSEYVHNPINPDTRENETAFRECVRDILDLDWSTRDETLFAELRRLKALDGKATTAVR